MEGRAHNPGIGNLLEAMHPCHVFALRRGMVASIKSSWGNNYEKVEFEIGR